MGEAKRRGTYEERKAAAIERDEKLLAAQRAIAAPRPERHAPPLDAALLAHYLAIVGKQMRRGKL